MDASAGEGIQQGGRQLGSRIAEGTFNRFG
jgi:hypothetical protein